MKGRHPRSAKPLDDDLIDRVADGAPVLVQCLDPARGETSDLPAVQGDPLGSVDTSAGPGHPLSRNLSRTRPSSQTIAGVSRGDPGTRVSPPGDGDARPLCNVPHRPGWRRRCAPRRPAAREASGGAGIILAAVFNRSAPRHRLWAGPDDGPPVPRAGLPGRPTV